MTSSESALADLAARLVGTDASLSTSLRDILTAALQELIEAELTATIGAAPDERIPERPTYVPRVTLGHRVIHNQLCMVVHCGVNGLI